MKEKHGSADAAAADHPVANVSNRAIKVASTVVAGASSVVESAEAVARGAGLTNRKGKISRVRLLRASFSPIETTKKILASASEELQDRAKPDRRQ